MWANIVPTSTTIEGTGPYTWTYELELALDQNVNAGSAPSISPLPQENLASAGFFTIYDFGGYIAGSCGGPAGWECTNQNEGFTPSDVMPVDDPSLTNITWAYTSGPTIVGSPAGVELGSFFAESAFGTPTLVSYAARGIANAGPQIGTIADNVGNTQAPAVVPLPAAVWLFGAALGSLVVTRRRRDA